MHWNDAWRLAVTATIKAQMMSSGSELPVGQPIERERHLRVLADKLLFKVEKRGDRFTLSRTIDVWRPVRHERLTLNKAETLPGTWKLRGLQGG